MRFLLEGSRESELDLEDRYVIYINRYVGFDEPKNDGSGETVSGKSTWRSFQGRKKINNFILHGECYGHKWLDSYNIPRYK